MLARVLFIVASLFVTSCCLAADQVKVLSPSGPLILVPGEPLHFEVEVQVQSPEFVGSATVRAEKALTHEPLLRQTIVSPRHDDHEIFRFALETRRLTPGLHIFLAEAFKFSGALVAPPIRLPVRVVSRPPLLLKQPRSNETLRDATEIVGEVQEGTRAALIQVFKDGTPFTTSPARAFRIPWRAVGEVPGPHAISASVTDAQGYTYVAPPVHVNVPPLVVLEGYRPGDTIVVQPGATMVSGRVTLLRPQGTKYVQYLMDGATVATAEAPPWTVEWDAAAREDAECELSARAVLENGDTLQSAPVKVRLFNYIVDAIWARARLKELQRDYDDALAEANLPWVGSGTVEDNRLRDRALEGKKRATQLLAELSTLKLKLAVTLMAEGLFSSQNEARTLLDQVVESCGTTSTLGKLGLKWLRQIPGVRPVNGL